MKEFMIKLIKIMLLPIGMLYTFFRRKNAFVILMYHRVNNDVQKELAVREGDFRWQMDYLQKKGYKIVSLEEALRLGQNRKERGKYVVLTFDDGYADYFTIAYPVLTAHRYPSLVYIVPGFVQSGRTFWWDQDIGGSPLMRWDQMREIAEQGLTQFGSHTMTHPDFDRIGSEEAKNELLQSRVAIAQNLGMEPRHFAYPRGIVGHVSETADCYETATAIFDGYDSRHANSPAPDYLMRLQRLPVQRSDGKLFFSARLKGWLAAEGWLKKLLGRH